MNGDPATTPVSTIPDVQGSADTRELAINKVGIKDIRHPVIVKDRSDGQQHTIATFSMFVFLNDHEKEISYTSFNEMLREMATLLEAESGYIEMNFPYFVNKQAPVSGVESLLDYEVSLIGEINSGVTSTRIKVQIPVTSLCPCSKSISDYGAHNQRSHVTLDAKTSGFIWIEELIDIVEKQASCELYGLLKRPDEKYVTERAYDNPKFVEDMVRDIAGELNKDDRIRQYVLESENFESIHNHSAYALIEFDKDSD
jgi:GTP cyclohydrolase I